MDGLNNKKDDLKMFLNSLDNRPQVIALTEINAKHYTQKTLESELNLDGYDLFCHNLSEKPHRGILIYTEKSLCASLLDIDTKFNEAITLKIKGKDNDLYISNIYRSPNSSPDNYKMLNNFIAKIAEYNGKKLLSDFNYPNINWKTLSGDSKVSDSEFLNCLGNNFLIQNVDSPTRARGNQNPHILDLVLTDDDFVDSINYFSPIGKSDHSVLSITCRWNYIYSDNTDKYNYSKGNYCSFRKYMIRNWEQEFNICSDNIDDYWVRLDTIIKEGMDNYIPKVESNSWKKKSSWNHPISAETKNYIKKKHRFQETRDIKYETEYKILRNLVRKESRKANKKEQKDVAKSCKENPKKIWNYIKSKSKCVNGIGDIKITDSDGAKILCDDQEKSNAFVNYFSSVFTLEKDDVTERMENNPKINYNMLDLVITEKMVLDKLLKLKVDKSPGPDCLHPRLLREIANELAYPLAFIFNISLKSGTLPEEWKTSIVAAIHKKGSKSDIANYRPVSLTCVACKIQESIIRDHIMQHFLENRLFSNKQYGFIKGRSTSLQLLKLLDEWTRSLEEGGHIDVIYTDFEKAFDKVPHKRLLQKLDAYGISKDIVKWIKEFLCYRKHRVRINGKFSEWRSVLSGIPQGSVLGPLLFIIYINDLPESCDESVGLLLFADDSKLYKHIKNENDNTLLQKVCCQLQDWSEKWLLKLNVKKCTIISINRNEEDIKFDYTLNCPNGTLKLNYVDNIKDLGILIDSDLNFREHVAEKNKKG